MQKPVEKSKIKKRKKVNTIVIFDDFERLDFEKISIKTLMGYLHSLILQQIKLVIACNEKEILKTTNEEDKTEYKDFREKVFDRRYAITSSDSTQHTTFRKSGAFLQRNKVCIGCKNKELVRKYFLQNANLV